MPFTSLGLSENILKAIYEQGYSEPTPVQKQAVPLILEGSDVLIGSQTGTGKTAGFTWPLLQRLSKSSRDGLVVKALILTPTRELAAQVGESVKTYGKYMNLKSTIIFGGVNIKPQLKQLKAGVDIIIATPGRLLDHVNQKTVDLSRVEFLVLDEADRMLDMGFIHDIRKLLALLPRQRQTLLFSATFSEEIKALARGFMKSPKTVDVTRENTTVEIITQVVHPVDNKNKTSMLTEIITAGNWTQVLVFTRTKHGANKLTDKLSIAGITASAIHGNKSQAARTKALKDFKEGSIRVLVATDIAARGLDINQLPHVVNFELPQVPEDYVHRIGRTGRAGNSGAAISLVCIDEHKLLRDIERLIKEKIPQVIIPGYAPDPSIKAEPIINGRRGNGPSQGTAHNRPPSRAHSPKKRPSYSSYPKR